MVTRRPNGSRAPANGRAVALHPWLDGYYALSEYYRPIPELDEWLRRRMRMCYVKQWPKPRTRIKQLLKLGVPHDMAIPIGMSSKGWWKLLRTYATQLGIHPVGYANYLCESSLCDLSYGVNNAWLARQGLISIKELWCAYHYPQFTPWDIPL